MRTLSRSQIRSHPAARLLRDGGHLPQHRNALRHGGGFAKSAPDQTDRAAHRGSAAEGRAVAFRRGARPQRDAARRFEKGARRDDRRAEKGPPRRHAGSERRARAAADQPGRRVGGGAEFLRHQRAAEGARGGCPRPPGTRHGCGVRRDAARRHPQPDFRTRGRIRDDYGQPTFRARRTGQAGGESAARIRQRAQHRGRARHSREDQRAARTGGVDRRAGKSADRARPGQPCLALAFRPRDRRERGQFRHVRAATHKCRAARSPRAGPARRRMVGEKAHPRNRAQPHLSARLGV